MKFVSAVVALSLVAVAAVQAAKKDCPPGQYYDIDYEGCEECENGSYKATKGPEACEPCPENAFAKMGSTKCIQCLEGQALLKSGKCGTCPPGTRWDKSDTMACKKCDKSTFQPYENTREYCFSCAGNANSQKGATSCSMCPAGKALMKNGKCGVCPPGTFYESFSQKCEQCPRGSFQPDENIRDDYECLKCSGDTNSAKGATKCLKCPFGKVYLKSGKCGVCRQGWGYASYEVKCIKCENNQYSSGKGIYQKCKDCRGSFYSLAGDKKCKPCPVGTALVLKKGKAKCRACPTGKYYDRYFAACETCWDTSGSGATGGRGISSGGDNEYCTFCGLGDKPNADFTKCV